MRLIYEIVGDVREPDVLNVSGVFIVEGLIGETPYFTSGKNEFFMQDLSKVNDYEVIEAFFNIGLNRNNTTRTEFNIDNE